MDFPRLFSFSEKSMAKPPRASLNKGTQEIPTWRHTGRFEVSILLTQIWSVCP